MKRLFRAFLNVRGYIWVIVKGVPDLIQLSLLIAELSAGSGADIPKMQGVPERNISEVSNCWVSDFK